MFFLLDIGVYWCYSAHYDSMSAARLSAEMQLILHLCDSQVHHDAVRNFSECMCHFASVVELFKLH